LYETLVNKIFSDESWPYLTEDEADWRGFCYYI